MLSNRSLKTFWNFQTLRTSGNLQSASRLSRIARHVIYEMSLLCKMLHWNSYPCTLLVTLIRSNQRFFFFSISIEQREIICERGASGRKSNDLRNWIKPKRKLRNRASSPYGKEKEREPTGTFLRTRVHTGCQRKVPSGVLRVPCSSSSLSIFLSPSSTANYPSEWNAGPGFRFAFGACPLTERVSHSIRNNALSAEALFQNDSCCPRGYVLWPHARPRARTDDYYFSAGRVFSLSCKPLAVSKRDNCVSACVWVG